jgi:hypothetical protein
MGAMDVLLYLNWMVAAVAAIYSLYLARKYTRRRWLRITGFALSVYIFFVYLWVTTGVMSAASIPLFLRGFQAAFALYIIIEGWNNNA